MELRQIVNRKYSELFTTRLHYAVLMGGRGAGRSTVASQFANAKLVASDYFRCAIMRFVLGDIRNSIYREILDRAEENGIKELLDINDSQMVIRYGKNYINAVGFKKSSGDQKSKLKSLANYNVIIIEEADEIPEKDFMQLDDSLRTLKGDILVILLLNPPVKDHWIIKRWFDLMPSGMKDFYIPKLKEGIDNVLFLLTSYLDNVENIAPEAVERYESYKNTKPEHYWNMVKGLVPETVKGKIYSNWAEIDSIPHEAQLVRRGLDFGYSVDPSALVNVYRYNGGIILDEVTYRKGLLNKNLADIINAEDGWALVVGDSAEPKSIDEIKEYGVDIVGVRKKSGEGSKESWKKWSIGVVQGQKISVTKRSKNIWKEYGSYAWKIDKDGNVLPVTTGQDHAMNAIEYATTDLFSNGIEQTEQEEADRLLSRLRNTKPKST